ncbi:hypothetical protein GUJ93_ZPchr0147g2921 [Zizania palustris]|uniref:NAC domain-containing protein n=1 Tax=Zizania palustris TaxID=103762 RepID=A0A8J5RTM9_ZIZPA|nr:hypothetical protein GUJ93_ZPchr0147g2921 [Zizania palustris]
MAVMEIQALPLGFRFHPTDEELIRHYLKGKITGTIRAEAEVIPEIDVCKCEPWDLPDKSLIRSDDPEWFFFAPKDRKYPNGSRSNRATEAGYWKATGKDRVIKSKGDKKKQHMIGMKKTLVFHRGRAPKGERTGWIMHEYRTTEPDFESGEQGGYVLYRLFRKQEEKSERPSLDEMDRSGNSPSPSHSIPDNMEPKEEANTPLNKEFQEPALHESPIDLPGSTIESQVAPITRWLADRTDDMATNEANISHMTLHGLVDGGARVSEVKLFASPSVGALAQLIDSQKNIHDIDELAPFPSTELSLEDFFFGDFEAFGNFDGNTNPPDPLEEFLNQTLADPDDHSSATSKVQYDSDTEILPTEFENNMMMQGENGDQATSLGAVLCAAAWVLGAVLFCAPPPTPPEASQRRPRRAHASSGPANAGASPTRTPPPANADSDAETRTPPASSHAARPACSSQRRHRRARHQPRRRRRARGTPPANAAPTPTLRARLQLSLVQPPAASHAARTPAPATACARPAPGTPRARPAPAVKTQDLPPKGEFIDDQNMLENINFLPDETNPQLSALYENAPLLPYDSTDQDVLSMDSGAESLQELFNSMDDLNGKKDGWNNEPVLPGIGFSAIPWQSQSNVHPNCLFSHQGNAPRRLRLQESLFANVERGDECEDEESGIVTSNYADEDAEESAEEKDIPSVGDEAESTGITIQRRRHAPTASYGDDAECTGIIIQRRRDAPTASYEDDAESTGTTIQGWRHASTASSNSLFTQQGAAVRRLLLQVDINAEPCSSIDSSSSCIIHKIESESECNIEKAEKAEIEEHAGTNLAEGVDLSGICHDCAQKDIPEHDAKSVVRLRKTAEGSGKEKQEGGLDPHLTRRAPGKKGSFPVYFIWLVLLVALLLLISLGIYGWI